MTFPEYHDEESFVWCVGDLPNPDAYATALLMTRRDLARELLAAYRDAERMWKIRYDPHGHKTVAEMQAIGLLCMGPGLHLSAYAIVVRNRLLQLINTGALEEPLENDPEEEPHGAD